MQRQGGQDFEHKQSAVSGACRLIFVLAAVLLVVPARVSAEPLIKQRESALDDFVKFDESKAEKWKELEAMLPSWPEDSHLVRVRMPVTYTLKIYVDEKSVLRAADGVARFTLVVEGTSGARNVFFEGYHCETREYKTYAFGTSDKIFEPIKKPKWERVPYYDENAFRFQLLRYYVCDPEHLSLALLPQDFVRRLKDATSE
ncbi:MAG: hypothetical protein HY082_02020 [Gammaproteobacteria bacterium]|nr:hypothetical protein [Gammaproteobacteria bacterium]